MSTTRFHVGQRVRNTYNDDTGTVTEITARGFRWRLDSPRSLGPRHGWYQEGESFTDEGWTVARPMNASDASGSPARQGAEPDGQDLNPVSVKDLSASASPATKEQQ